MVLDVFEVIAPLHIERMNDVSHVPKWSGSTGQHQVIAVPPFQLQVREHVHRLGRLQAEVRCEAVQEEEHGDEIQASRSGDYRAANDALHGPLSAISCNQVQDGERPRQPGQCEV
ncbi:hypothetical protein D9M69_466230 [compost metagenome]